MAIAPVIRWIQEDFPNVTFSGKGLPAALCTVFLLREDAEVDLGFHPCCGHVRIISRLYRSVGFLFRNKILKEIWETKRIFVSFRGCAFFIKFFSLKNWSLHQYLSFLLLFAFGVTLDCPDVHARCRQQVVEFPKELPDTRRCAALSAEASLGIRCFLETLSCAPIKSGLLS